ncbi:hypothetical protein C5167_035591 [Papaver somniferum]|uniref:Uncharacterized protein n=1 Tax=Papaver somniferum TaxID=3469 RepID=A0A4Y7KIE5_PAPSO|nr:hypothetical protein C5167_035591 [Papaver somniferum]
MNDISILLRARYTEPRERKKAHALSTFFSLRLSLFPYSLFVLGLGFFDCKPNRRFDCEGLVGCLSKLNRHEELEEFS